MAGYVVVQVKINDPVRFEEYRAMVPATLEKYGGRFLVRGGATETLEGTWNPPRLVILEFDSVEQAKRWWDSKEYLEPKRLRQAMNTSVEKTHQLVEAAERRTPAMKFDQMIAEGNQEGRALVMAAIDALVAQTSALEDLARTLDLDSSGAQPF